MMKDNDPENQKATHAGRFWNMYVEHVESCLSRFGTAIIYPAGTKRKQVPCNQEKER